MHVIVKELSPHIQDALASVGYHVKDIRVVAAQMLDTQAIANDGQRAYCIIVNLDTGEHKAMSGNWAGGGWASGSNIVDAGSDRVPMPLNAAVIKGTQGHPRTFATLYAHPNTTGKMLPSGEDEALSDDDQQALYCFGAIKGGEYRRDEMRRRNVSDATVDSLVERGYLKRNKAGATQITTSGKNARTIRY